MGFLLPETMKSRRKQWWVIKNFPAKKTHLKILIFGQENPLENSDFRPLYIHIYMQREKEERENEQEFSGEISGEISLFPAREKWVLITHHYIYMQRERIQWVLQGFEEPSAGNLAGKVAGNLAGKKEEEEEDDVA